MLHHILSKPPLVQRVRKPAALLAAEDALKAARDHREKLRGEAAAATAAYLAKPTVAGERLARDFSARAAEAEEAIVIARRRRAELLPAWQEEAARLIEPEIAQAAAILKRAAEEARAAFAALTEAAQFSGQEPLRAKIDPFAAVTLDRLVAFADDLGKLDVIGDEA